MTDRYEVQGSCLLSSKKPYFMTIYDNFDPMARERLRNSHYDLCTVCIYKIARKIREERRSSEYPESFICEAIDEMEFMIRTGSAPQAQ